MKRLWRLKVVRLICACALIIIGVLGLVLPYPGFIPLFLGIIILLGDVSSLRMIAAYMLKRSRRMRTVLKKTREILCKTTGRRFLFKRMKYTKEEDVSQ